MSRAGRRGVDPAIHGLLATRETGGWPGLRRYLLLGWVSAAVQAVLAIGFAAALARLLVAAVDGHLDSAALAATLGIAVFRGAYVGVHQYLTARAAVVAKEGLRRRLLAGYRADDRSSGELATLVGRGVDGLDGYLTGYLPQLSVAVVVPLAVLAAITFADPASGLVVALTVPLVPIFAVLVGLRTKAATERQWTRLRRLGGHFLDTLTGLPTLRAYGRARAHADTVAAMADGYRSATMSTLRIAFLSALVLELVATLSVALVAVPIGLRLLSGGIGLPEAFLVLILAPEAYAPLRAVGAKFHASQEGLAAARDAFAHIRPDERRPGTVPPHGDIVFDNVTVRYGDTTVLDGVSFIVAAGERVALVGPSGAGKSTILALLLGFITPADGTIRIGGIGLSTVDIDLWRARLAWLPQRPHLFAATVADNIRLGRPAATDDEVRVAARAARLAEVVEALPLGYDTPLGERGAGLSSGQRQRLGLARAYLRTEADVLLLDEPTARLDPDSEAAVLIAGRELMAGRTALVVAHRPALLDSVDRVLHVADGRVWTDPPRDISGISPPPRPSPGTFPGNVPQGVGAERSEARE